MNKYHPFQGVAIVYWKQRSYTSALTGGAYSVITKGNFEILIVWLTFVGILHTYQMFINY